MCCSQAPSDERTSPAVMVARDEPQPARQRGPATGRRRSCRARTQPATMERERHHQPLPARIDLVSRVAPDRWLSGWFAETEHEWNASRGRDPRDLRATGFASIRPGRWSRSNTFFQPVRTPTREIINPADCFTLVPDGVVSRSASSACTGPDASRSRAMSWRTRASSPLPPLPDSAGLAWRASPGGAYREGSSVRHRHRRRG